MNLHLTRLLRPERIALGATAVDRLSAIDTLIDLHQATGVLCDAGRYRADVLLREAEGSTALGHALAVPHGKSSGVLSPALAAITLPQGVAWAAPDGLPCRLLFLIAAPLDKADLHLQILARLMKLLVEEPLRQKLLQATTPQAFHAAIHQMERKVFPHDFP